MVAMLLAMVLFPVLISVHKPLVTVETIVEI